MALSTYAELQASIAAYLFDRSDLTDHITDFIRLVEVQVDKEIRALDQMTRKTATIDAQYTALPTGFLEMRRFSLDGKERPLRMLTPEELTDMRDADDTSGEPKFMAVIGRTLEVYPSPDQAYTGEMLFFQAVTPLANDNTSNWLLEYHPDCYLYGALVHAGQFLADEAMLKRFSPLYAASLQGIQGATEKARFGGPLKMTIRRTGT